MPDTEYKRPPIEKRVKGYRVVAFAAPETVEPLGLRIKEILERDPRARWTYVEKYDGSDSITVEPGLTLQQWHENHRGAFRGPIDVVRQDNPEGVHFSAELGRTARSLGFAAYRYADEDAARAAYHSEQKWDRVPVDRVEIEDSGLETYIEVHHINENKVGWIRRFVLDRRDSHQEDIQAEALEALAAEGRTLTPDDLQALADGLRWGGDTIASLLAREDREERVRDGYEYAQRVREREGK